MPNLEKTLEGLTPAHVAALRWFRDHAGQRLSFKEIQGYSKNVSRLLTQFKGIYKPEYTEFALSVKQTLNSPYPDMKIEHLDNGDWYYQYFQENEDPSKRDTEATNRGLVRCMAEGIPVGVLIQKSPKPGVTYLVQGLAYVSTWEDGWFTLDGITNQEYQNKFPVQSDAEKALIEAERVLQVDPFNINSNFEMRLRAISEVVRRRGQAKFRSKLMEAYGNRCAITGCDATQALEAAHISPYLGDAANHIQNGLLLRADIHTLFDLGDIAIDPTTMIVCVSPELLNTDYGVYHGHRLSVPEVTTNHPSRDALRIHFDWSRVAVTL